MNRALRAVTLGVLLFSPAALTACSAGQVTQTETQIRDKVGPMAEVGDIVLRGVKLAYPNDGSYESGDDAELQMAIVNRGSEDDALVDIAGDGFDRVRITGGGTAAGAGDNGSSGSNGSGGNREVAIPADSALYLGEEGPTVTLAGLSEELTPGQTIELTFEFENAGEVSVLAQVATPSREVPRGEAFDFHQEETGQDSNEAAHGAGTGDGG